MDDDLPRSLTSTTRIELVRLPARTDDRWSLRSEYVDLVWIELLGVTAVAVARRLEHLLSLQPPARGVSLDSLATPLRIPAGKALDALRRLHHYRLIEFREHTAVIGASGLAPSIPEDRVEQLSAYTRRLRVVLEAGSPTPHLGSGPGAGSRDVGGTRRLGVEL
jgi:hypothetical protein